jgi:hypothetical protein
MMFKCITGISWFLDTNVIGDPKAIDLFRMHNLGWIYLQTPDTVYNELATNRDEADRGRLLNLRAPFPTPMGPHVLGRSTLGLSVIGSDLDQQQIEKIHLALWQGVSFSEDSIIGSNDEGLYGKKKSKEARSRVGDTLIVQTTIRYCKEVLVTQDKGILLGASRVREKVGNFRAYSVPEATVIAMQACHRRRSLREAQIGRSWDVELPDWP